MGGRSINPKIGEKEDNYFKVNLMKFESRLRRFTKQMPVLWRKGKLSFYH